MPDKAGARPDHELLRRSIAAAILVWTVLLVGTGAVDAFAQENGRLAVVLGLVILWLPVGLMIASRIRRRPTPTGRMTGLEVATAAITIAVGVILVMYLMRTVPSWAFMILGILAVPASLVTWHRAQSRRSAGRPMTGLQVTASILFLGVLVPTLFVTSLVIGLYLVCLANGPIQLH